MIENVKDNKFTLLNEEQNKGYEDEIIKLIELKNYYMEVKMNNNEYMKVAVEEANINMKENL